MSSTSASADEPLDRIEIARCTTPALSEDDVRFLNSAQKLIRKSFMNPDNYYRDYDPLFQLPGAESYSIHAASAPFLDLLLAAQLTRYKNFYHALAILEKSEFGFVSQYSCVPSEAYTFLLPLRQINLISILDNSSGATHYKNIVRGLQSPSFTRLSPKIAICTLLYVPINKNGWNLLSELPIDGKICVSTDP